MPADAAEARLTTLLQSPSTHDCVTGTKKACKTFSLLSIEDMISTVSKMKGGGLNLYSLSAKAVTDSATLALLTDSLFSIAQVGHLL